MPACLCSQASDDASCIKIGKYSIGSNYVLSISELFGILALPPKHTTGQKEVVSNMRQSEKDFHPSVKKLYHEEEEEERFTHPWQPTRLIGWKLYHEEDGLLNARCTRNVCTGNATCPMFMTGNGVTRVKHHVCFCFLARACYMYRPSGTPSFFLYSTFSLAFLKSACVTRMRRSLKASRPASVQAALISAPDKSSCITVWYASKPLQVRRSAKKSDWNPGRCALLCLVATTMQAMHAHKL